MQALTTFGDLVVGSSPGDYLNAAATLTLAFNDTVLLPTATAASTSQSDAIRRLLGAGTP
jgi:hypothetical protein